MRFLLALIVLLFMVSGCADRSASAFHEPSIDEETIRYAVIYDHDYSESLVLVGIVLETEETIFVSYPPIEVQAINLVHYADGKIHVRGDVSSVRYDINSDSWSDVISVSSFEVLRWETN